MIDSYGCVVTTPDGEMKIIAHIGWLTVNFSVFVKLETETVKLELRKLKNNYNIFKMLEKFHICFDAPEKKVFSYALFFAEIAFLVFSFWLMFSEAYLEGVALMLLSIIGLTKVKIK